ncbi:peptidoglycan/xylan/chitin deacetylase (PgdA/CDA1 family) [Arthrobacter oryzae]|uniref:Peptidoglycan/xylan/chitin deacetylase (PgdA/CDA1 family) n=2 Tax=Arthrobacter oryzae TaxID=409290 RepID=A0A495EU33_9MICC|nr:peptidoglycan/xylan/chitin deacetylase (PgdA/CDA1 family) [Arthrobacter oryzae]
MIAGGRRRLMVIAAVTALGLLAAGVALLLLRGLPTASPPVPRASGSVPATASASAGPPTTSPAPAPAPVTSQPVPAPPPVIPPAPVPTGAAPVPPAVPFPVALAGRDLEAIPGAGAAVALTFDAGANAAGLPSILQSLAAAGVRATFFLTGSWAAANPGGVAAIVAGGHRVGNHSMTHPAFTGLSDAGIADQIKSAERAIRAAGADPRPFFRFPFGDRDARTIAAVNNLGYLPVRWSVDSLGWKGTSGGVTAQLVVTRVLAGLRPGEIVLMHVGSNPDDRTTLDADALPRLISRIRQAGYGFTTLDALLG